jgi:hypothetical protein
MILEYPGVVGNGEIYLDVMKAICGDTSDKSMVDLMCHHAPYTPMLGFKERTYIDIQNRGTDHVSELDKFIIDDVVKGEWDRYLGQVDVTICSDGIEHLSINDALLLLKKMQTSSEKQILFTPLGECSITNDNDPDSHKSGWRPEILNLLLVDQWAYIVFPNFHPSLNVGAFFFWCCDDILEDFERVKLELKNKQWTK